MRFARSLRWRIALAYTALMLIALAAVSFYLVYYFHDSYEEDLGRVVLTVCLAGLLAAVVAIGMGLVIGRRSSHGVREVTEGARRFARGELDHRLNAGAADETRELADSFNSMADSLKSSIQNMTDERNKLEVVVDAMADGVMVIDSDQKVSLLNPAARELLGIRDAGIGGVNLSDSIGVSWLGGREGMTLQWVRLFPDLRGLIATCSEQGTRQQADLEFFGPRRVVSAVATPLGEGGKTAGVLLTLHDLTRIRQMERSQQEFVSNVSHELRNPLAAMKAMVETLENGAIQQGDSAADFLRRLHQEIDRVTLLGDDLLELSRLEGGRPEIDSAPVDLLALAEEVRAEFADGGRNKGVVIEVSGVGEQSEAMGDRRRLRQVLVNLAENALKFTGEGGTVSFNVKLEGAYVQLEVADTGPGIGTQHLPHLFERFYKADRARQDGGSGLGLAIVKQIVTAHGGEVNVRSQVGVGSTFSVSIPRVR